MIPLKNIKIQQLSIGYLLDDKFYNIYFGVEQISNYIIRLFSKTIIEDIYIDCRSATVIDVSGNSITSTSDKIETIAKIVRNPLYDRVEKLENQIKNNVDSITYDENTGIFTIVNESGVITTIDLPTENIVIYTGSVGEQIDITVTGGEISATLRDSTISWDNLTAELQTLINSSGSGGSIDWADILNKPEFSTVAISGDYNDLINTPIIPSIVGLATTEYVNTELATKTENITASNLGITIEGNKDNTTIGLNIDNTATKGNVEISITPNGLIATVDNSKFEAIVVDVLPGEGVGSTYYLVETATTNVYEKWLWVQTTADVFEFISLGTTELDLSLYTQNSEFDTKVQTYITANYTPVDMLVEYTDGTSETFKVLTQN